MSEQIFKRHRGNLCKRCKIENCFFRGHYTELKKQKFNGREVVCGYESEKYVKSSLKRKLPK